MAPGPGGRGTPVQMHQKMLRERERQRVLERQRARNRCGGLAQANHQLPGNTGTGLRPHSWGPSVGPEASQRANSLSPLRPQGLPQGVEAESLGIGGARGGLSGGAANASGASLEDGDSVKGVTSLVQGDSWHDNVHGSFISEECVDNLPVMNLGDETGGAEVLVAPLPQLPRPQASSPSPSPAGVGASAGAAGAAQAWGGGGGLTRQPLPGPASDSVEEFGVREVCRQGLVQPTDFVPASSSSAPVPAQPLPEVCRFCSTDFTEDCVFCRRCGSRRPEPADTLVIPHQTATPCRSPSPMFAPGVVPAVTTPTASVPAQQHPPAPSPARKGRFGWSLFGRRGEGSGGPPAKQAGASTSDQADAVERVQSLTGVEEFGAEVTPFRPAS